MKCSDSYYVTLRLVSPSLPLSLSISLTLIHDIRSFTDHRPPPFYPLVLLCWLHTIRPLFFFFFSFSPLSRGSAHVRRAQPEACVHCAHNLYSLPSKGALFFSILFKGSFRSQNETLKVLGTPSILPLSLSRSCVRVCMIILFPPRTQRSTAISRRMKSKTKDVPRMERDSVRESKEMREWLP